MKETTVHHVKLSSSNKRGLVMILCILLLFSVMNSTMFMVSIPDIAEYFNILPSKVSWVITAYIIFYAVGSLLYGKLSDIYPIKILLILGVSFFASGSIVGFFASEFYMVVLARVIQACGAAAFPAIVFTIPSRFFPNERGRLLGLFSSIMAFGAGLGPILGGVIAGFLDWHYIFLFSSIAVLTLPLLVFILPKEGRKKVESVDYLGASIFVIAIVSFILFITSFNWYLLLNSIVFILLFVWWIMRSPVPFINPAMFKNTKFTVAILTSFLGSIIMFGNMFILPQVLRDINLLNTMHIGLVLFPGAMASALIGGITGKFTDHFGPERTTVIGFSFIFLGAILMSTFIGFSPIIISCIFIISFIAFPFFQTSMTSIISNVLQKDNLGVGMGIYTLGNFIAGAFGGSIIGKFLDFQHSNFLLNPLAQINSDGLIYSNLFFIAAFITIMGGIFFIVMNVLEDKKIIKEKREIENSIREKIH